MRAAPGDVFSGDGTWSQESDRASSKAAPRSTRKRIRNLLNLANSRQRTGKTAEKAFFFCFLQTLQGGGFLVPRIHAGEVGPYRRPPRPGRT